MNIINQAIAVQNEPFSTTKRTRRITSSVSDIVHQVFSSVQETSKIISKTSSSHDVNIGRCESAFKSISNISRPERIESRTSPRSRSSSAFDMIAAAATAAAIRTTSFDSQASNNSSSSIQGRSSSSSWEASAAEAELSADLISLSVSATSLSDNVRKFLDGQREQLNNDCIDPAKVPDWKEQLSPEAVEAALAAEEREGSLTLESKLNEGGFKKAVTKGDVVGTFLGKGKVISIRKDGFICVELHWCLAGNQRALAYVLEQSVKS
jgi:hypothetical protein